MSVTIPTDSVRVWEMVRAWPPQQRLALATRILQSLEHDWDSAELPRERQEVLGKLIGIWKTDRPLNDAEVKQIVEEERMKKYG